MTRLSTSLAALALGLLLQPALAGAGELLRCKGPDGKVVFTDDKAVCPNATPFEPQGRVSGASPSPKQKTPSVARVTPTRRLQRANAEAIEEAEAARWRARRTEKEAELAALAKRREKLGSFVTVCNRRGRVVTFDEAGIKREVRCEEVQERFAKLDDEEAEIRDYLENGLADDCRRAGCLPGWIR